MTAVLTAAEELLDTLVLVLPTWCVVVLALCGFVLVAYMLVSWDRRRWVRLQDNSSDPLPRVLLIFFGRKPPGA